MMYYIPGCDVVRNHPEASAWARAYFRDKSIPEGPCCRKNLGQIKAGDTIVVNCTQCSLIFEERLPEVRILTLYEYLLNESDFRWPDYHHRVMTLQDCWRMRSHPDVTEAIRKCIGNMNIEIRELEKKRENADFCGVWLNNPAPADCIEAAPVLFADLQKYRHILSAEEQKEKMADYVRQLPSQETIVYCNGCEKGLRLGGGKPVHMIGLLFCDNQTVCL